MYFLWITLIRELRTSCLVIFYICITNSHQVVGYFFHLKQSRYD